MTYDPSRYWGDLHRRDDLSAVGQSALPAAFNRWLYRVLARRLAGLVRRHGIGRPGRVFEVGAGTGYWVEWWLARGAGRIDGCDLVPDAVERLGRRFDPGRVAIRVADISDPAGLGDARYDLVDCHNVLLHVTEDEAFDRALRNVGRLVAPGGHLLMTEPILLHPEFVRPYDPAKHSRARPLAAYAGPLEAVGLELVAVEPSTVLGNNPMEAGSAEAFARWQRWWGAVARRVKRRRLWCELLGVFVYLADPLALRTGAAPSSKVAIFRRPRD